MIPLSYPQITAVACPACGAPQWEPCFPLGEANEYGHRAKDYGEVLTQPHVERQLAAESARRDG